MTPEVIGFIILFIAALVLFSIELFPADVTALGLMLALIVTGMLPAKEAFAGFGSETVLMILGLLILTEGLVRTGFINNLGKLLVTQIGGSVKRLEVILLVVPATISAFISNTASTALFLPITLGLANRAKISASRLLMPLAFGTILAGSVTLIGTSTNLVVSGLMQQHNLAPLGMFELTPVGLPILIVGLIYMHFVGRNFVPDRTGSEPEGRYVDDRLYFSEIHIQPGSNIAGKSIGDSLLTRELNLGAINMFRAGETLKPLKDVVLQGDDVLLVEGSKKNILALQTTPGVKIRGDVKSLATYLENEKFQVAEVVLLPGSRLLGRSIKGLQLRERYQLQILAINQAGHISYNKIGQVVLHLGDILLIQLPTDTLRLLETERLFRVLDIIDPSLEPNNHKARLSGLIFLGAMLLAILNVFSIAVAVLLGALVMFLTRCITPEQAYREIEWKTLILIGSMLAFGQAMAATGTASFLAGLLTSFSLIQSPIILLGLFFLLAVVLTQPMSNQAAAAVLIPIAIESATLLGFNPRPFAIMIALAASCSFITPLEPASVLVYGAGKYRFYDFVRVGTPLTLIIFVIALVLVPLIWGF